MSSTVLGYGAALHAVGGGVCGRVQATAVFAGKHGFITPRDLFKWAGRGGLGYHELAEAGAMLLAERLRDPRERALVGETLESVMRVKVRHTQQFWVHECLTQAP